VRQINQQISARAAAGLVTTPATVTFVDTGEPLREQARQVLIDAQGQVHDVGDAAARAVATARDKAPEGPGLWSKVGAAFESIKDVAADLGAGLVNGVASFANAIGQHPGDALTAVAGMALMDVSAGGEALGVALDATGIGALGGVPLNIVSAAGITAGAGLTAVGTGSLTQHAVTDSRVSPMESRAEQPSGSSRGTPTDRAKQHLTERDLDAARRELDGEVVATKSTGTPWNHVEEVRQTQRRLVKRIDQLQRQLGDSRTAAGDRPALEAELSEASRLLDHSEKFVPRH
jgi:hypothetical protein